MSCFTNLCNVRSVDLFLLLMKPVELTSTEFTVQLWPVMSLIKCEYFCAFSAFRWPMFIVSSVRRFRSSCSPEVEPLGFMFLTQFQPKNFRSGTRSAIFFLPEYGHFCQKCPSLCAQKWHFGYPNKNSFATFISLTSPKNDGIVFGFRRFLLLDWFSANFYS